MGRFSAGEMQQNLEKCLSSSEGKLSRREVTVLKVKVQLPKGNKLFSDVA